MNGKEIRESLRKLSHPLGVIYISSYIPRKCGIATFTKDLTNAINLINPLSLARIIAMDNGGGSRIKYPHEVKKRIKQEVWKDYKEAAKYINKSKDIDLVSLQHEFGIYGGEMGEMVVNFVNLIKKPIITTLHTVQGKPDEKQREIIRVLCKRSKYTVVMIEAAAKILKSKYNINSSKVVTIHHGVPDFPRLESKYWERKMRLNNKAVMTSVNLLGEGKGIEYAIKAIPKIVKHVPNFLYIVVGQTHPQHLKYLKRKFGRDVYREKLLKIADELDIRKHVRFVNKYVSLNKVISYIGASDFYITPYLDSQQAASGSLAYAIGAGKLCISTPYLYAKEMLSEGRGILVPFENSQKIADAIIRSYRSPKEKERKEYKAYEKGRTMTWANVGHLYFHLFQQTVSKNQ